MTASPSSGESLTMITIRSPPIILRRAKRPTGLNLGTIVSLAVADSYSVSVDRSRPDRSLTGLALIAVAVCCSRAATVMVMLLAIIVSILAVTMTVTTTMMVVMTMSSPVVVVVAAAVDCGVVASAAAVATLGVPARDQYLPHVVRVRVRVWRYSLSLSEKEGESVAPGVA